MLSIIICLVLLAFLFYNYRKTVITITVISAFLSAQGILQANVLGIISVPMLMLLPFNVRSRNIHIGKFPFIVVFFILLLSFFLSTYFAEDKHYMTMLLVACEATICPVVFWVVLMENKERTVKYAMRVSIIYASFICFYSLYESALQVNPFVDYMKSIGTYSYNYDLQIRFGLKRCYTFFPMHITNGAVSIILFSILLYAKIKKIIQGRYVDIIIVLLGFNAFATGARSVIISFLIASLFFVNKKFITMKHIFVLYIIAIIIFVGLWDYIKNIMDAFIHTDSVAGSNSDMREVQLELALFFLNQSFWLGNGMGFTYYVITNYKEMMGAESLWFPVMMEQGVLGVIAYILFFIFIIIYGFKEEMKNLAFFSIGFLVLFTMTSVPCIYPTHIVSYLFILLAIKSCQMNNLNKNDISIHKNCKD